MTPYYADDTVTLYLGDCREVLPALLDEVDCIVTDPPYGETSLTWDRWPTGWPAALVGMGASLWCFGSMRMFLERRNEFADWQLAQDVVWEKHNGSGFASDRFKRVHEHAVHWYRGPWSALYRAPQFTQDAVARRMHRRHRPPHMGDVGASSYASQDGGPRLMRSVLAVRSMHGSAIHPTEKPIGILDPLIRYSCPPGGVVLDPFAGSGSTLDAARSSARRAVGIEAREDYCEAIARRLSQAVIA